MLNDWNEKEAARAEKAWGKLMTFYTKDMFEFIYAPNEIILDLGCGFGRFLDWIKKEKEIEDPPYFGYDSSENMIERLLAKHPEYKLRIFLKDLTAPITHTANAILISAVFIHITVEDQVKILNSVLTLKPKRLSFDINCPNENAIDRLKIKQIEYTERWMKTKAGTSKFRMTYQSHHDMTRRILTQFTDYKLTTKFYTIRPDQHKVCYFLERK